VTAVVAYFIGGLCAGVACGMFLFFAAAAGWGRDV
jgi:hypothetical protein